MTVSFSDLGVPRTLVASLNDNGITSPFPIQVDTLPDTLAGRDVLGRGRTGSGKTLAFSIPLTARLARVDWCWPLPASWPRRSPRSSNPLHGSPGCG